MVNHGHESKLKSISTRNQKKKQKHPSLGSPEGNLREREPEDSLG